MITPFQAKYFAHELTKRCPSDSIGKLAATLADAQVDLNPHQIDAALFAFRSPLSKGAILADEVGLGKTIEAGILLSQKWAERKRNLLVLVPAALRKQWYQELADKFFLESVILEKKSFEGIIKQGNLNPFKQKDKVVICSYHFARAKESYILQTPFDLVVIDEAHRLRNVYKPTNKVANSIKRSLAAYPKVLLTATPLQNSLLELYGLVSVVDDYCFGDLGSFKAQFSDLSEDETYKQLKQRLKPICQRTLRRQVLEYVKYTNRVSITQEFYPSAEEQRLYEMVSDYLCQDGLFALPKGQRTLMTLILRKLLASSSFAISGTLGALAEKLEEAAKKQEETDATPEQVAPDFEPLESMLDEWVDDDEEEEKDGETGAKKSRQYTPEEMDSMGKEIAQLREFEALAKSIVKNAKGEVLLQALEKGFAKSKELGAPQKAIIFTESTRTQEYLRQVLEASVFKGRTVLFNGTNANPQAREIYQQWLARHKGTAKVSGSRTADSRQALVEYFQESADIMIATEAAAEGINLQFCNLVVNYDLPWNPQRVEQRIGRCHRYGQKHDVVVVNFLNKTNEADQYVYQILDEKFKLFSGVFGASDEVLGSIASGVDFEKRISEILDRCRTSKEIETGFAQLRLKLEEPIQETMAKTRQKLMENFDVEVQEKLRVSRQESVAALNRYEEWLWLITRHFLRDAADFKDEKEEKSFILKTNPFPGEEIPEGPYRIGRDVEDAYLYRVGHPLARRVIEACKGVETPVARVVFDYTGTGRNIAAVEPLVGKSGWIRVTQLTITALETEDHVLAVGMTDGDQQLDTDQVRRMFSLNARVESETVPGISGEVNTRLDALVAGRNSWVEAEIERKNGEYFDQELEKLDYWAEDQKEGLERDLKDMDKAMKEARRASLMAGPLAEKLEAQKSLREIESQRNKKRRELFAAQDAIEAKRGDLITGLEAKLNRKSEMLPVITCQWRLI